MTLKECAEKEGEIYLLFNPEDGQQVVIGYQHCDSSIVIPIKDRSEFEAFCNEVDEEAKKSHKRDYLKFINS